MTLLLAPHLGPRGITVNVVLPGATATDMNPGAQDPVRSQQLAQTIALRGSASRRTSPTSSSSWSATPAAG